MSKPFFLWTGSKRKLAPLIELRMADLKGVKWLLSNSDTPWVRDEYRNYSIKTCDRAGSINSDPSKRGLVAGDFM